MQLPEDPFRRGEDQEPMTTQKVVFVVGENADPLDLTGPLDVFTHANMIVGSSCYETTIIGSCSPLRTLGGMRIVPDSTMTQSHTFGPDATLMVVGPAPGEGDDLIRAMAAWIRDHHTTRMASVCIGAFVLAEAGLLDGRTATTHWAFAAQLAREYPNIDVSADAIFVRDANIWTAAGVSAGIDLALALVEEDLGHQIALAVAQRLVLFLRRPGGQSQFSAALRAGAVADDALSKLVAWVPANLSEDLSVPSLASRAGMSRRNFTRRFTAVIGDSPGSWVESVRLDAARRLVETTSLSLEEVARRCGFGLAANMRRVFLRRVGTTASEYRTRFAAADLLPPGT